MPGGETLKKELVRQMRSLARRSRSREEVRARLRERDLEEDTVEEVLSELSRHGFIDDSRYAAEYVRSRLRAGYGPERIRRELTERGVDSTRIDAALDSESADLPEEEVLREALARRLRTRGEPSGPRELKNLVAFLARRGFSHDLVRRELEEYFTRILG